MSYIYSACYSDSFSLYISSFTELDKESIAMALDGDELTVVSPLDDPNAVLEIVIYNPSDNNAVLSSGNAACEKTDQNSIECRQYLERPKGESKVKVIVTEILDRKVLKSALLEYLCKYCIAQYLGCLYFLLGF